MIGIHASPKEQETGYKNPRTDESDKPIKKDRDYSDKIEDRKPQDKENSDSGK